MSSEGLGWRAKVPQRGSDADPPEAEQHLVIRNRLKDSFGSNFDNKNIIAHVYCIYTIYYHKFCIEKNRRDARHKAILMITENLQYGSR